MTTDPLTTTFAALADPTRRAILARLASGEATVLELAEPFAISLPAISRHLKVLEENLAPDADEHEPTGDIEALAQERAEDHEATSTSPRPSGWTSTVRCSRLTNASRAPR